jgi:hypothetical protein
VYIAAPPAIIPVYGPIGVWFSADYLLWWTKDSRVPPLATAGVAGSTGLLGPANPETLFDGGDVDNGARSGGRFTLGFWCMESHAIGLEAGYFFLGRHTEPLAFGEEESFPTGTLPGTFLVSLSSLLQSAEVSAVSNLANTGCFRCDFLAGFRYLRLDESLHVEQDFTSADFGEQDTWDDEFHTHNNFYGGQVGARAEYMHNRFFVDVSGKVALGVTDQQVVINGGLTQAFTTFSTDAFGNPVQNVQVYRSPGGLLAQPATYSRDYFTVVPEVSITVGYQLTSYFRASLGYNFLYWSSVARPGDQVSGVPRGTDFWAQGLNCMLAFTF